MDIHEAAPAALGENVLRDTPPGPVQLTQSQREEILKELDRCRNRLADLEDVFRGDVDRILDLMSNKTTRIEIRFDDWIAHGRNIGGAWHVYKEKNEKSFYMCCSFVAAIKKAAEKAWVR